MRGYTVVLEPGRRIVKEEIDSGGSALPWIDEKAFLKRAVELAVNDFQLARSNADWVFFDRGLIDAISGLQHLRAASEFKPLLDKYRYNEHVFMAPPWPEIYLTDKERQHNFEDAVAEYERLLLIYPSLNYRVSVLPKVSVSQRVDYLLKLLIS